VGRRRLPITGLAILLVAAAVAVGLALARDDDGTPRFAGRIAVVDGCGLRHMWPDGTDQRELCLPGIWESASLSADGKTFAWDTANGTQSGISFAKADGSDQHVLPVPREANVAPSLSPDGRQVAFLHSARDDGRYDVWTTSTGALSDTSQQATAVRDVSFVAWAPRGDRLAYVKDWSEETLEGKIVLVRPNGDDERLLGQGDEPAWTPDGKHIAFVHDGNLWTVALDGSERRLIVRDGRSPAWSRDGKEIAFMREERCGRPVCKDRLFLVFADGSNPHAVGPKFSSPHRVLWLPDPNE
jgi:Tol biopolymer transport system component